MKARAKLCVAALFVVLVVAACLATLTRIATAQTGAGKIQWTLLLNDTRGPIRTADVSTLSGKGAVSEILGGPTSGSDSGYLIYTRMPTGAHGPALFTLPVDDYYVVLAGKMNVQIGTDKFVAGPLTGVIIPANTPHSVWNDGAEQEANLEVISSVNPTKDLARDLLAMVKPAEPKKVENAAQYIRQIKLPAPSELKPGLNRQTWTNRAMGSPVTVAIDSTSPGSGGPKPHVHRFEQVYFMLEGETTVMYGLDNPKAKKNDIVILAPGVVHTNNNQSSAMERHITLLLPEPTSQPFDIEFEMRGAAGPAGSAAAPNR